MSLYVSSLYVRPPNVHSRPRCVAPDLMHDLMHCANVVVVSFCLLRGSRVANLTARRKEITQPHMAAGETKQIDAPAPSTLMRAHELSAEERARSPSKAIDVAEHYDLNLLEQRLRNGGSEELELTTSRPESVAVAGAQQETYPTRAGMPVVHVREKNHSPEVTQVDHEPNQPTQPEAPLTSSSFVPPVPKPTRPSLAASGGPAPRSQTGPAACVPSGGLPSRPHPVVPPLVTPTDLAATRRPASARRPTMSSLRSSAPAPTLPQSSRPRSQAGGGRHRTGESHLEAPGASSASSSARPVGPMSARTATSATGRRIGVDPLLAHGYATISPIANGAFSQVVRARHLTSHMEVAVKTFRRELLGKPENSHLLTAMKHELGLLQALSRVKSGPHPNVANLVAVHEGPVAIVCCLEYCGGGSVHKALQKAGACDRPHAFGLGEVISVRVAAQLATALAFLHGEGIAHRDIKPQNVLLTQPLPLAATPCNGRVPGGRNADPGPCTVKLCDFGFAVPCNGKPVRTVCGTPQYMAPELAAPGPGARKPYSPREVDLWAYGAMVYELLEGRPAFSGVGLTQLNERIRRANTNAFTEKTPAQAKALIKALLKAEPEERLAAPKAQRHPWFSHLRSSQQLWCEASQQLPTVEEPKEDGGN